MGRRAGSAQYVPGQPGHRVHRTPVPLVQALILHPAGDGRRLRPVRPHVHHPGHRQHVSWPLLAAPTLASALQLSASLYVAASISSLVPSLVITTASAFGASASPVPVSTSASRISSAGAASS